MACQDSNVRDDTADPAGLPTEAETRRQRDAATAIVRQLKGAGHVAYLAGGCVRDALLGRPPKDFDVATDAKPPKVRRLFARSQRVGEAFGVVLVHLQGVSIEVATFRREWGYADGRHPDHVVFTDAREDAQRRDFTINALFADPLASSSDPSPEPDAAGPWQAGLGRVIDFVGGVADLRARRVCAVGDASERFAEDYLRMLRAVRFASRLRFAIEDKTARAMAQQAKYLGQISRERIGQEVLWMLRESPEQRLHAVELMQRMKLDAPVLNESPTDAALTTLRALPPGAGPVCALAAWMLDRHAPAEAYAPPGADAFDRLAPAVHFARESALQLIPRWRRALCLSNLHRDRLRDVFQLLPTAAHWPQIPVAQRKRMLAHDGWPATLALLGALAGGEAGRIIAAEASPLMREGVAPEPLVTGQDLIDLGLKPSPAFGELLDRAYDEQLENRLSTRKQAMDWLKKAANP